MNIKNEYGNISSENPYRILLLTNIDSDNIGDQIIEACDTSILHSIMENLHIPANEYSIISRPEGIVSKKYVATKNPELLCNSDYAIRNCDLIVVGGAPLFNYKYQVFYERTATILDLAKKHNKPVIFSAIGIESYDNPAQSYRYEMLILDCTLYSQGKDAWVYTTGKCTAPEKCLWTIWQPQYGYYWTLFRVYDVQGNLIDEACFPFQNVY